MKGQSFQYATAVGLLLVGLVLGFQAGKARGVQTLVVADNVRAVAAPAVQPADYFPAQYVNKAKFVEALPAQF